MRRRPLTLVAVLGALALVPAACDSGASRAVPSGPIVVAVHDTEAGIPFDRRLLGTNVPAWIGPARLADPAFTAGIVSSGATVIRMPGGSWAGDYDWSACENETAACPFLGSARPSDFVGFLQTTGLAGMWTMNVNETAQEGAALVAFFNGRADDDRQIGVDRNGVDWKTVGTWAQLRARHAHSQPVPVGLWEIGNETYGGKGDGDGDGDCASFAWEHSWTCDGAAYVAGDPGHDGFVAIAAAMKAVDPSIRIGAVGVADGSAWSSWGDEVMHGAAGSMDFYVIHQYAFDGPPSTAGALRQPASAWKHTIDDVRDSAAGAPVVPIAVTEYNLVAGQDADDDALMTKAVNALFIADTIGQMAEQGVALANQWNAINGKASNGTDYGMIDDTGLRAPQFYALALWSHFGTTVVPAVVSDTAANRFAAYASRDADGSVITVMINKTSVPRDVQVSTAALHGPVTASIATVAAADLAATTVTWNGAPVDSDTSAPALADLGAVALPLTRQLPPFSISLVRIAPLPAA